MSKKKRYNLSILKASVLSTLAFSSINPTIGQIVKPLSQVNTPYDEQHPVISPSGDLFFTVAFHPMNQAGSKDLGDIWMTVKNNVSDYGIPVQVKGLSTSGYDVAVGFPDEQTVLIYHDGRERPQGIHEYAKAGNSWEYRKPLNMGSFRNQSSLFGGRLSSSGDVLILSLASYGSFGNEDIYVSLLNDEGNWSTPQNLGPQINTYQQELTPYLSEDKRLLFFSANGHGSVQGMDIFYAERLDESWDNWTTPRLLANANTLGAELGYFRVEGDPETAILTTTQNSEGYGDLQIVQAQEVPRTVEIKDENIAVTERPTVAAQEAPKAPEAVPEDVKRIIPEKIAVPQNSVPEEIPVARPSLDSTKMQEVPVIEEKMIAVSSDETIRLEVLDINTLNPIDYSVTFRDALGVRSSAMKNTDYQNSFPIGTSNLGEATITSIGYLPMTIKPETLTVSKPIFMSPATKGISMVLENVQFKRGTSELLDDGSTAFIGELAGFLQENPGIRILLEGHTDNLGNVQLNKELSLNRASAIRDLLVQQGVEFQRVRIAGWGGAKPIESNQTEDGRTKNRRVEMVIVDQ